MPRPVYLDYNATAPILPALRPEVAYLVAMLVIFLALLSVRRMGVPSLACPGPAGPPPGPANRSHGRRTGLGSVACAIGWAAACASCLTLARRNRDLVKLSVFGSAIAALGLVVSVGLALMKVIPIVPGHFTVYEWLALAVWCALGGLAAFAK